MRAKVILIQLPEFEAPLHNLGIVTTSLNAIHELDGFPRTSATPIVCMNSTELRFPNVSTQIRQIKAKIPFGQIYVWGPELTPAQVRLLLKSGVRDIVLDQSPAVIANSLISNLESNKSLARKSRPINRVDRSRFQGMISRSPAMWDIFDQCEQIANSDASVLILGETGTGKELLARAIHDLSDRSGRFVAIDCGAIPETLVESQLFGHKKGSFTGAGRDREGFFQQADQGTLFFDEVGNVSLSVQMSLLRAIQEGRVRPVGAESEQLVDVRIIAATNEELENAVAEQRFREDLLYRLDVIRLNLPPLRQRKEDILLIFEHFLRRYQHRKKRLIQLTEDFADSALNYPWPGNIRELENLAHRLSILYPGQRVDASHFEKLTGRTNTTISREPTKTVSSQENPPTTISSPTSIDLSQSLSDYMAPIIEHYERQYLCAQLEHHRGRINNTAEAAEIHRRTLLRKLKQYKIDKKTYKDKNRNR